MWGKVANYWMLIWIEPLYQLICRCLIAGRFGETSYEGAQNGKTCLPLTSRNQRQGYYCSFWNSSFPWSLGPNWSPKADQPSTLSFEIPDSLLSPNLDPTSNSKTWVPLTHSLWREAKSCPHRIPCLPRSHLVASSLISRLVTPRSNSWSKTLEWPYQGATCGACCTSQSLWFGSLIRKHWKISSFAESSTMI